MLFNSKTIARESNKKFVSLLSLKQAGDRAYMYVVLSHPKAKTSDPMTSLLFDLGSIFSYVIRKFSLGWEIKYEFLDSSMCVSTLVGVLVCVYQVYRACIVMFMCYRTLDDLIILDMVNFYIILIMSQLSPYCSIIYCYANTITIAMFKIERLEQEGNFMSTPQRIILATTTKSQLCKGQSIPYHLWGKLLAVPRISLVSILCEFIGVFTDEFPSMPPDREFD